MTTEIKCENCKLKRFMVLDTTRGVKRPVCLNETLAREEEYNGKKVQAVEICDTQHFEDKR